MSKKYKPLPWFLTIRPSKIHGLGLFTKKYIPSDAVLGISHHKKFFQKELIRTPLGGFVNHSKKPNCKLVKSGHKYYLTTIKKIHPDQELTLKYHMYKV
jgi:SET domain-containing protein